MRWRVRPVLVDGPGERRLRHVTACLTCTLRCAHCALPVRLNGKSDHPGYGVVDEHHAPGVRGFPDLGLLHRFCRDTLGRGLTVELAVRRAYLGHVTELYETGGRSRRYERLGVRPPRPGSPELYRKRWRVAKMRYACKACRYYTGSH
ncbi:hypothetical protein [Amycolatopsis samaneae]|uniref:Uncharacterized protein n=1 Tax=Amycolatopsis samaneae TaxID=664691 RepID=A0ABW5GLJ4_9PSEU